MLWDSATRGVKVNMAIAGPAIVALGLIVAGSAIYGSEKFDRIVRGGMKCSTKMGMAPTRRGNDGRLQPPKNERLPGHWHVCVLSLR